MAKQTKKKKNSMTKVQRERELKKEKMFNRCVLTSLAGITGLWVLLYFLFNTIYKQEAEGVLFSSSVTPNSVIWVCCYAIFAVYVAYINTKIRGKFKNTKNEKIAQGFIISLSIAIISCLTFALLRVYIVDTDKISRRNLLTSQTIEYGYDDIEKVVLRFDRKSTGKYGLGNDTFVYEIHMQDGTEHELELYNFEYTSFENVKQFNQKIFDKCITYNSYEDNDIAYAVEDKYEDYFIEFISTIKIVDDE